MGIVKDMLPAANLMARTPVPASHLILGLQCGGSEATRASPPIRRSATQSIGWSRTGAPRILSETPEIYGAEHLLTRRAVSREVGEKLIARIKWWGITPNAITAR